MHAYQLYSNISGGLQNILSKSLSLNEAKINKSFNFSAILKSVAQIHSAISTQYSVKPKIKYKDKKM